MGSQMGDFQVWPLWSLLLNVAALLVAYALLLAVYRITFHPLAKFPGPRLAAITRYYEGYFDLYQKGKYTFKIAELHQEYGPIVRISPQELHVSDPAFFNTLYRHDEHLDKYDWAVNAFSAPGATIFTASHQVHRARRQPIAAFFSKQKVAGRQDMIRGHQDKLRRRLDKCAEDRKAFEFGAAITAFARDVASDFILGKSYNCLEYEDFNVALLSASQGSGEIWRITKFVRIFGPLLQTLPLPWLIKIADGDIKTFFEHVQETRVDTRAIMASARSSGPDAKGPRTVVHDIMDSRLPASEKTFERIMDDVATVTGAGFETTASALRLIFFHIFTNSDILSQLQAELSAAGATPGRLLDLKVLEQLPYLTAILHEGLRLSPGIATRMARRAPGNGFVYDRWQIPAGTPVAMTLLLMQTDEATFPDPKRFEPNRWIESGSLKTASIGFAPFSRGTRNCLGMHLAWAEMYMLVADIVQHFNLVFPEAKAEDFECESDQFAIGTKGKGMLKATISHHYARDGSCD